MSAADASPLAGASGIYFTETCLMTSLRCGSGELAEALRGRGFCRYVRREYSSRFGWRYHFADTSRALEMVRSRDAERLARLKPVTRDPRTGKLML